MRIQPLDDRVLVVPLENVEQTVAGLIIPDTAKEKPQQGRVVAVGTDEDLQQKIKEGDIVLFGKYAGQELKFQGTEYIILGRSDILAVIVP